MKRLKKTKSLESLNLYYLLSRKLLIHLKSYLLICKVNFLFEKIPIPFLSQLFGFLIFLPDSGHSSTNLWSINVFQRSR